MPPKSAPFRWTKTLTPTQLDTLIRSEPDPRRALSLLDTATLSTPSISPIPATLSHLTSRLASAGLFPLAVSLLHRSVSFLPSAPEPALLSLLRAFGRARRPLAALHLFESAPTNLHLPHSSRSYTALLAVLVSNSELPLARSVLSRMRDAKIPPTTATFNVIIKAYLNTGNAESINPALDVFNRMESPDACSYNTIIDGLCKHGRVGEAKELYSKMVDVGIMPTVVTYTSMIHWMAKSGRFGDALELFEEMGRNGVAPNVVTYSSLIDGLCKGGKAGKAVELVDRMVKEKMLPNTITYSLVIDGLCKEGRVRDAMEVLDRMLVQGRKPGAGLFGKLIVGLCDTGQAREAANYLDEMVLAGVSPNRVTWSLHVRVNNAVVGALCGTGELGRAFQVYQSMRTRGVSIEPSTFHLLVERFCKKGDLEKAGRVVHDMLFERCLPERDTWAVIVGEYSKRKKARQVADQIWNKLLVS